MEFEQIYNTYFKAVYRYIWQLAYGGGQRPLVRSRTAAVRSE